MIISTFTLAIQRTLISLNLAQTLYLAVNYFSNALANRFPVFENMFVSDVAKVCTSSNCWQAIVPFLGSTYFSIALISILALCFRPGRELRLIIVGLASVHLVMATARLFAVPAEFYLVGVALKASVFQYIFAALMLSAAALPYAKPKLNELRRRHSKG